MILKYFPNLSKNQIDKLEQLPQLYQEWNEKINVISRKDIEELATRHILHSLSIAKFITFNDGSNILDLGTGGGFPGVPLAILFPNCRFHLVDSIGKKITVVKEISKALELENLEASHERVEKIKGKYDFVVSRAVAKTKQLYIWTHQKFKSENKNSLENGWILLKGGNLTDEMKEFGKAYTETNISDYFSEDFFETKKIIYVPRIC